jgi:iron complex transport system ATP-binding protein
MTILASLAEVGVQRDGRWLLKDVNWTIEASQRWVILGPNGAGKTTLLTLLASLMHPTSGELIVLGEKVGATDVFELRPRVGFASSEMAKRIPRSESVLDAVLTAAHAVTGRWREDYDDIDLRRAKRVLAEWEIEGLATRTVGTLSDGELKRVQIARAVMTDPELLLLDEPAGSLDLAGREDMIGLLDRFAAWSQAPAMVMVTHHVEEIPHSFTHALLLKEGTVLAQGPLETTVTAQHLSELFERSLELERHGGRLSARSSANNLLR